MLLLANNALVDLVVDFENEMAEKSVEKLFCA
jgi:hypothetical protein